MEKIIEYVKPELFALIPVLYFIGLGLKKLDTIKDNYIPLILGAFGIVMSFLWILGASDIFEMKDVFIMVFTGIVQGVLCAGLSVYINQIYKQVSKVKKEDV